MSFLQEILVSKGLAEAEELNDKIQEISKHVGLLKEEVIGTMEDNHVNYTCLSDDTNMLMNKMRTLTALVNDVKDRIDCQIKQDLVSSKDQIDVLTKAYQEATLSYDLVQRLLSIHTALEAARNVNNNNKFLETAHQLKVAEEDLKKESGGLECLHIFEALEGEIVIEQAKHSHYTLKMWAQCVSWSDNVSENGQKTVTLTLASNIDKEELFKALHYHDLLVSEMRDFSEKLLNDVLCPIIDKVTVVDYEGKPNHALVVKIDTQQKRPPCLNIINNLTIVFNFLTLQLSLKTDDGLSFTNECSKHISKEFCRYFVKNCLTLAVPKRREELEGYTTIVEEIVAFELLLKDIGFLDKNDNSIGEYACNIEELFATKTCEAFLAAARNVMKKDLHDIKQVGKVESNAPEDLEITVQLSELSPFTFHFPSCQISKSTEELLELVEEMLREIPQNTDTCAVKLFYTARNIFTMYCDVVPHFHSRLLDSIPQQSAILHNNAMYLAHQLTFLGAKYTPSLPPALHSRVTTFIDLVDPLRRLASDVLTKQLQTQKKHIINILRDSGLVTLSDSPKFPTGVEKAIRQCLRQLALLQTVWQHILPVNVYCKVLGLLCNAFVEEIIQKVLAAEDIPADTSTQLVVVFTLIQQKAPQVFPEPGEIHRHVKKWAKLTELQLVLGAGLAEVDDRWADGKGPLAQEFTADQVRHLVRALFQISDRRAVLLAKIV